MLTHAAAHLWGRPIKGQGTPNRRGVPTGSTILQHHSSPYFSLLQSCELGPSVGSPRGGNKIRRAGKRVGKLRRSEFPLWCHPSPAEFCDDCQIWASNVKAVDFAMISSGDTQITVMNSPVGNYCFVAVQTNECGLVLVPFEPLPLRFTGHESFWTT